MLRVRAYAISFIAWLYPVLDFAFGLKLFPTIFCYSLSLKVGADIANICNEAAIYAARRRTKRGIEQRVKTLEPPFFQFRVTYGNKLLRMEM